MESGQDLLRFGPFRVDAFQRLWRGDQLVDLAARPLAVLRYLAERPGQVVTKQELLRELWAGTYVTRAVLKVAVRTIREALGEDARAPQYIETVGWEGYRFIASLREEARDLRLETSPSSPQVSSLQSLAPNFVGRESELRQLHSWLEKALQGQRQLVFVTGEPGIGKTTVVDLFQARLQGKSQGVCIGRGQCVEQYGQGEAYLPILEALSRLAREPGGMRVVEVLRRYAPTWLAQLPALLGAGERRELQATVLGATQQRMLRELAEVLEALAVERPLILILEDLHWSDVSTLEVLAYVGQRRDRARLLIIGTYRPIEVIMQRHRLKGVKQELETRGQCAELRLELLTVGDVNAYLTARFADGSFLPTLATEVHRRTEGNALFMVNLVEAWIRQGIIAREDGHWRVQELFAANHTPETVRQMIEKQLERLGKQEQRILETASVVGAEFTVAAVAAGLKGDLDEIEDRCEAFALQRHFLEERGIAEWPDGTVSGRYGFRHVLYQNVLYDRIAEMRRMRLHRLIGERLETGYGEQTTEVAAELAVHFEHGRDYSRAVQYRLQAGQKASQRLAFKEAIAHLNQGMEILGTLPQSAERDGKELDLRIRLGMAWLGLKGWIAPEMWTSLHPALELAKSLGRYDALLTVYQGLSESVLIQGRATESLDWINEMLAAAEDSGAPDLLLMAHWMAGLAYFWSGDLTRSRMHDDSLLALYDEERHRHLVDLINTAPTSDVGVHGSLGTWMQGYPDRAMQLCAAGDAHARRRGHPFDLSWMLAGGCLMWDCRREPALLLARAEETERLGHAHSLPFISDVLAQIMEGIAWLRAGRLAEGIPQLREAAETWKAQGGGLWMPYFRAVLAEGLALSGDLEGGLSLIEESLAQIARPGWEERWYLAEILRLKGWMLALQGNLASAEQNYLASLDWGREQQAKSWELRTSTSLARLWQQQGKKEEARQMLAEIYGWFTEGFDTKDLQEAKILLEELS